MAKSQVTSIASSAGAPGLYPVGRTASKVNTQSPLINNQAMQQTLGSSTDSKSVVVPALAANTPKDVIFTIPISGFPSPFIIAQKGAGKVQASVNLVKPPTNSSTIVGTPALSLYFGTAQTSPGSGVWSISAGQSYQNPTLHVTVRVFSPVSVPEQTLTFVAHSTLLAQPPA